MLFKNFNVETCNFAVVENRKPRLAMSTAADKQN